MNEQPILDDDGEEHKVVLPPMKSPYKSVDEILTYLQSSVWHRVLEDGAKFPSTPVAAYNMLDRSEAKASLLKLLLNCRPEKWEENTNFTPSKNASPSFYQTLGHNKAIDQFTANIKKLFEEDTQDD